MVAIDRGLRQRWQWNGSEGTFEMPTGWMQGRSVFGGLTGAAAGALARRLVEQPDRALRLAHVQLVAPVLPGTVHGTARIVREGRNTTFVDVQLSQQDMIRATASFVFARPIATTITVSPPPAPAIADPETLPRLPYIEGVLPEFTQNVDMRWASGQMPFSNAPEAKFVGCFRYLEPVADAEGVLALLDTYPSPTLSILSKPAPASTVAWTAHLLSLPEPTDGWYRIVYRTIAGSAGMHTCQATLYGPDDACLAWSEQLFAVFSA
jgi:acyl-CoA thioesterase